MLIRWLVIGMLALIPSCVIWPAEAQEIVLSPRTGTGGMPDFWDLFRPGAPWKEVAAHITSLEVGTGAFGSKAHLREMSAFLRKRHIVLGVGLSPLTSSNWDFCGRIEGYSAPQQPLADAERLRSFGVQPNYYGMDEPLWFGHFYSGPASCRSSIREVAKEVAEKVRQVRSVFPHARIGDVEPISALWKVSPHRWVANLETWIRDYRAATGQNLAFFRLDMEWRGGWQTHIAKLWALLYRNGIPLQIIYNSGAHTNAAWTRRAAEHFKEFETGSWPLPAAAVFQCWTPNPSRLLPDSDPATITGLVRSYIVWRKLVAPSRRH